MTAEITIQQVWYNPSLLDFFFRSQAERTLRELAERAVNFEHALGYIEDYAYNNMLTLDDIEEMFYSYGDGTLEDLCKEFGIELTDTEDETDEEEEDDED